MEELEKVLNIIEDELSFVEFELDYLEDEIRKCSTREYKFISSDDYTKIQEALDRREKIWRDRMAYQHLKYRIEKELMNKY